MANRIAEVVVLHMQPLPDATAVEWQQTDKEGFNELICYYPEAKTTVGRYWRFWLYRLRAWKWLKKLCGKPDLVHVQVAFPAGLFALWLSWFCRIPYVVTEHSSGYLPQNHNHMPRLHRLVFMGARRCTAVSRHLAHAIKTMSGINKCKRLPNVVLNTFYKRQHTTERSATVLHVSNFLPLKNPLLIIQGLHTFLTNNPHARLIMIGEEGPEKDACRQFASTNGLSHQVRFEGEMQPAALAALMRNALCLATYSRYETQGITVLEALASGLPVLSANIEPMNTYQLDAVRIVTDHMQLSAEAAYLLQHPELADSDEMETFARQFSEEELIRKFAKLYDIDQ